MNTYKTFNSDEFYKRSAVTDYINYYDPAKNSVQELYQNFQRTPIFYVAVEGKRIIGMIRGRPERVSNLFVAKMSHNKGIGTKLMHTFETQAKKLNSKEIKIRASLYATPFYEKIGYQKTTGIRNFRGLKVQPMKKVL